MDNRNKIQRLMKRVPRLVVALWLSILIVWLGAGVSLVHCGHTGAVEIMQMSAINMADDSGCCKPMAPCMDVKVLKLSPSQRAPFLSFDFSLLPVLAFICPTIVDVKALALCARHEVGTVTRVWHGPPRVWLSIIRVLQI